MIALLNHAKSQIGELCRRYDVEQLHVFGSAVHGDFDPARSDIDFVVKFRRRTPDGEYADRFLGLAEELERLLGCHVDLITTESVRNRFFRREVESNRELVYAA